jgi:hypothetical protein
MSPSPAAKLSRAQNEGIHEARVAAMKEGQNMLTEEQKIAQAERAEQAFRCLQIAILNIAGSIASGATDALIENLKKVRSFMKRDALKNPGWDDGGFHQTAFELVDDLLAKARNAARENVAKISTE